MNTGVEWLHKQVYIPLGPFPSATDIAVPGAHANSLDVFFEAVRSSVDGHAKRKNYTDAGPDGENRMLTVMRAMGIDVQHGIGEIVYKAAEYLKAPRRVLLEKIAGWAFVLWREHPDA